MCPATDHIGTDIRIVATARYIPASRVQPDAPAACEPVRPSDAKEALMQSVYTDTLRWRGTDTPVTPTFNGHARAALRASAICTVATETGLALSDMALLAARRLAQALPLGPGAAANAPAIDQIIVCQSSFEHDLTLSCACRVHHELQSGRIPFAIGQLQGASFLMALQVAEAMMVSHPQMRTVLVVAAERWRAPFQRTIGSLSVLGDGAAAVLVRRDAPGGTDAGWTVRSITTCTPVVPRSVARGREYVDSPTLARIIDETLQRAHMSPAAIDWVLPARINPALTHRITVRCGLPSERVWRPDATDTGYLCAADTPAHLDSLLRSIKPSPGQRILMWSAGFQGQAACALLEYRGT